MSTTDVNGAERDDTSPAALRTVLDDLRARREAEHASVSVSHRSRSNLELFTDLVVLENVDTNPGTERHARGVADADRLTLGTGGRGSWGCRRTAESVGEVSEDVGARLEGVERDLHEHIATRLARLGSDGLSVDTAPARDSDTSDPDPAVRAEAEQRRGESLHAQFVLSATVTVATDRTVLRPELFIAEGAVPRAGELAGFHQLGAVEIPGDVSNAIVLAAVRERLLDALDPVVDLAVGLSFDVLGGDGQADRYIGTAAQNWDPALGRGLIHLVMGNLAGKHGRLADAEREYRAAAQEGATSRASLGLAEVSFQRGACGPPTMDRAALAEAERLYGEALTGEAPDSARVAERVALGIGRVAVCLSQAGVVDRWDDAERELTAVTSAYERDVTGVRELASEAHALLAVVSLPEASAPDTQGRLWDAEEHARQAVELAVQPGRRGVHLGQLGSSLARLGRTTEARDAYLEAAELDPQRAETYRARAAEMDGG